MRRAGRALAGGDSTNPIVDFIDRRRRDLVVVVALEWLGLMAFRFSTEWGIGLIAAGIIGAGYAIAFDEGQRRDRLRDAAELAAAEEQAGIDQMRTIAWLAREILLDSSVWTDIDEVRDFADADTTVSRKRVPPPRLAWSISAIVARGRKALKPLDVNGWQTIAQLISDHADYLTTRIDQEFPGQPAERRSELVSLFKAAGQAASGAKALADARDRAIALAPDAPFAERERARQSVSDGADFFFGACEWVQGCVERLDDRAEFAESIAAVAEGHREIAARIRAAQVEIQEITVAAAVALLKHAAPAPEYLEVSTIGNRNATLRELAIGTSFAFAPASEAISLDDWMRRIAPAGRSFHVAVMDRGGEMTDRTRFLWTRIHNDCLPQLEQAIMKLAADVKALANAQADTRDRLEADIAERRVELHDSVNTIVARIDELQTVSVE